MKEKTISWQEFLNVAKLMEEASKKSPKVVSLPGEERINEDCNSVFFRGVSKASYELKTSLDRIKENMSLGEYYKIIGQASVEVQRNSPPGSKRIPQLGPN